MVIRCARLVIKLFLSLLFLLFFFFAERSESYQHLFNNYKRIPELLSMDSFSKSHFFNENLKSRSHTYLTPKVSKREERERANEVI